MVEGLYLWSQMKRTKPYITGAILFLVIFHFIGLVGLHLDSTRELFQSLIPMNLLLSLGVLLLFHRSWNLRFGIFIFGIFWFGYLAEVIGVATGVIFGNYEYGSALGFKVAGAPPMIGVNWVILIYCCGTIAKRLTPVLWWGALIGAGLMVGIDLVIEPMAIRFDFWQWSGGEIPLLNFFGWFVISYLMLLAWYYLDEEPDNPIASPLYVIQFLFFTAFLLIDWGSRS